MKLRGWASRNGLYSKCSLSGALGGAVGGGAAGPLLCPLVVLCAGSPWLFAPSRDRVDEAVLEEHLAEGQPELWAPGVHVADADPVRRPSPPGVSFQEHPLHGLLRELSGLVPA